MKNKTGNIFRKAARICNKQEIRSLYQAEKTQGLPGCTIYFKENNRYYFRCIIIVPKAAGTASKRNKLKRVIREQVRVSFKKNPRPVDFLIRVHPEENVLDTSIRKALSLWFEKLKQ